MSEQSNKLVIRNIGLMLSGRIEAPILDADCLVAVDGRIEAWGREADLDTEGATTIIDANGCTLAPGPDRQPRPPRGRRLHAPPAATGLDRQQPARRRHHNDLGRRGAHARASARHRGAEGAGDRRQRWYENFRPSGVKVLPARR
jgi:enamidase